MIVKKSTVAENKNDGDFIGRTTAPRDLESEDCFETAGVDVTSITRCDGKGDNWLLSVQYTV